MTNSPVQDTPVIYLDTSVLAGRVLVNDEEDKKSNLIWRRILENRYSHLTFITSKFSLIELAELISRKSSVAKAKELLFDLMYNTALHIQLMSPEEPHKIIKGGEYYDVDDLVANFVNTALDYNIPGYDTIHAHTVINTDGQVIVVSKDRHFRRFAKLENVTKIFKPSQFVSEYKIIYRRKKAPKAA